jgi:hypothetical protein
MHREDLNQDLYPWTPYHCAATKLVQKFGIVLFICSNRDKKQHTQIRMFMSQGQLDNAMRWYLLAAAWTDVYFLFVVLIRN